MYYDLMNKQHCVLRADLDQESNCFIEIIEKDEFEYAPLSILNCKEDLVEELNYWYHHRYMPDYRLDFYELIENLGLFEIYDYHHTYYCFNMSDQYWIKPVDSGLEFIDIVELRKHILPNFYHAGLLKETKLLPHYSDPNIATEGMLPKAWVNKGEKVVLIKGYLSTELEPYNEVFASMIGKHLGMDIIEYSLEKVNDHVFSICENFIDENHEIVVAEDILNGNYSMSNYLSILKDHGIDASKQFNDMLILDYLIMNTDRHMHNFGIIREVDTLKWIKPCPLYDHGTSLLSRNSENAKFFQDQEASFNIILSKIDTIPDLSCLNEVYDSFRSLCLDYPIEKQTVEEMIKIVDEQAQKLLNKMVLIS